MLVFWCSCHKLMLEPRSPNLNWVKDGDTKSDYPRFLTVDLLHLLSCLYSARSLPIRDRWSCHVEERLIVVLASLLLPSPDSFHTQLPFKLSSGASSGYLLHCLQHGRSDPSPLKQGLRHKISWLLTRRPHIDITFASRSLSIDPLCSLTIPIPVTCSAERLTKLLQILQV
jgi:hypothetical protein